MQTQNYKSNKLLEASSARSDPVFHRMGPTQKRRELKLLNLQKLHLKYFEGSINAESAENQLREDLERIFRMSISKYAVTFKVF